jgi:hypothetical protein
MIVLDGWGTTTVELDDRPYSHSIVAGGLLEMS